jgi:TetR/AcrR family transcriptional repressor of nem operon
MVTKGKQTRERILEQATKVFTRKGIAATTINDLLEATGTTKGNLYFHFSGKEEVGLEVLNRARETFRGFLDNSLKGDSPGAQLENFFCQVLEKNRCRGFVGGCLFGNTALESSDTAPLFANLVSEVFAEWIDKLRETLGAAQVAGQVRRDLPAEHLAELLVVAIEGGIMQARLKKAAGPLERSLETLRILLELKS